MLLIWRLGYYTDGAVLQTHLNYINFWMTYIWTADDQDAGTGYLKTNKGLVQIVQALIRLYISRDKFDLFSCKPISTT